MGYNHENNIQHPTPNAQWRNCQSSLGIWALGVGRFQWGLWRGAARWIKMRMAVISNYSRESVYDMLGGNQEDTMLSRNVVGAVMLAFGLSAQAQSSSVYLVKITDMAKVDAYEVMSREEVSALQKAIGEESRIFTAAMSAAKKGWSEDELTKGTTFPAAAFNLRKMQQQGPFSQEQALKKKEKALEREAASLEREMERNKKKGSKTDAAKEALREMSIRNAYDLLLTKMNELLKRDVPRNGF